MEFTMRVANRNVLVRCVYPGIYNMCRPYWAEENATSDMEIHIDEGMILAEIERIRQTNGHRFDANGMEKLLVHRLVSEALLSFDTLLIHGAAVALDGNAYIFSAESGIGKTTHVQKWLDNINGAYVVNGDKPFIVLREADEFPLVCGSPWAGKENLQTNTSVSLKAIVFLERAEENRMEHIPFIKALPCLLQQVYHPDDEGKMRKTLHLIQRMSSAVSFWSFQCNNFKDDCVDVAYNALVRERSNESV